MKKLLITLGILLIAASSVLAQSPQAFKYQAIVRDIEGNIISGQQISLKINLLQGSREGQVVYSEIHTLKTSPFGLINLEIGMGKNKTGEISTINWGLSKYFVNIEIDITGGNNYETMGVSQLLSVPYALYAENSGSGSKTYLDDWQTSSNYTYINNASAKVGINSTSATEMLELVGGNIEIGNGYAIIQNDTNLIRRYRYNFFVGSQNTALTSGEYNTFLGLEAGKVITTGSYNTANGYQALVANYSGRGNTANGYKALYSNTTGLNNTATGAKAMYSNVEGEHNAVTGDSALYSNTAGHYNTVTGAMALYSNIQGNYNTATGGKALYSNTASYNTANGYVALYSNTTGSYNTAMGDSALYSNVGGNYNTANGYQALFSNTTGANTAIGYRALYSNITGVNTAIGYRALFLNTTGNHNTAIGLEALKVNIDGDYNTANGLRTLWSNTTGDNNSAYGYNALYNNTTGHNNVSIGSFANKFNQTGSNNTAIGYQAGQGGTSPHNKSGNVFLGYKAGYYETGSDNLYIENSDSRSPLIYGDFENNYVKIEHHLTINNCDTVTSAPSGVVTLGKYNNFVFDLDVLIDEISAASTVENWAIIYIEFTEGGDNAIIRDGNNLILSEDHEYDADDMLTLQRRGENYYEISWSAN